jgi:hypothetical protein
LTFEPRSSKVKLMALWTQHDRRPANAKMIFALGSAAYACAQDTFGRTVEPSQS